MTIVGRSSLAMMADDNETTKVLHIGDLALQANVIPLTNVTWNEAEAKGYGPIINEHDEIWADWAGCNPKDRKLLAKALRTKTFVLYDFQGKTLLSFRHKYLVGESHKVARRGHLLTNIGTKCEAFVPSKAWPILDKVLRE